MDNDTNVHHFLQWIKSTELEAVVNVVWDKPKKYGKDFDVTVSYLGPMVTKKDNTMHKTGSQPAKPKVAVFTGKIGYKKYPKAVLNSMSREQ